MISFFSDFSKSWGAKIILGVLLISMVAFWGLGGLMNTSLSTNNTAIKVGSEKVSMNALSQAFDAQRGRMSAMMGGQYVSPAQALQAGMLDSAVQTMVIELVQSGVKDELGLAASDKAVQKYVERNPAFQDALGNFDKNIFYAYLAQAKTTEAQLAKQLKNELAMQHLTNTIIALGYNPTVLADLMYRYNNEKRTIVGALIEPQNIKISKQPTNEELQEYLDAYSENFILPEYRELSLVSITPENMADKVQLDDAQVNEIYEERKASFGTPEKRQLAQMLFDSEESAKAAVKGLTKDNFYQVAKEKAGQDEIQTNFGWTSKEDLLGDLADPVFAAKKNAIVGPVSTDLGWHILLVKDIQAANMPSKASILAQIKKQLASEQSYNTMENAVRKLEDVLGEGKTLEDAAAAIGLKVQKTAPVDITGTFKNGKSMDKEFKNITLLQDAFMLNTGDVSSVTENGNGYLVARIDSITPSAQKTFEEAKADLVKLWRAEQQKAQLETVAKNILDRAQKGTSLQAQGVFGNFKSFTENNVTRSTVAKMPPEAIAAAFMQETGNKNTISTPTRTGIFISTVENITPADPSKDSFGLNVTKQNLKSQTGEGMANEVMASYADEFGVKVNTVEIEKAFSVYAKDE